MTENEFKIMARNLDRVVIWRRDPSSRWEIWGYQDDNPALQNRLKSARSEARPFASVDSALVFIRRAGYVRSVEVDEGRLAPAQTDDVDETAGPR